LAHYNTILHQLLSLAPRHDFDDLVRQFQGDRYVKRFSTWNQFTVMLFAQASGKSSLRDIQNAFAAQAGHLYHLGLKSAVARSTLSDANASRDYRVYEKLFYRLQERCRSLAPKHQFRFKNPLFSIDSTVIELGLSAFPWARYSRTHGALKLHYGLDHAGNIPVFLNVTPNDARGSDVGVARQHWTIIPDSINCFDKGYIDFAWFRRIHDEKAFFVTRARKNFAYRVIGQQEASKNKSVVFDRIVEAELPATAQKFPAPLRLIGYFDSESGRHFEFLTNNFTLAAATIAQIYKARWQIEAFFKWIKQNLRIKSFLGTSKNAVLTQVWVAMCYLLLLAYIKFQAKYAFSLFYLHRVIRETILARFSILDLMHLNARRLARCQEPQLCLQI
jgi:hypothetical protein